MTHLPHILHRGLAAALLLGPALACLGQTPQAEPQACDGLCDGLCAEADTAARWSRVSERTLMGGAGTANVLDTYLSPYNYTGTALRLLHETRRDVRLSPCLTAEVVSAADVDAEFIENPARNINEYAGGLRYSLAALARIRPVRRPFTLSAGPQLSVYAGGIYNDKGGNNPAQAKADITLDAVCAATYRFRALSRPFRLRYGLSVPLAGVAFAMNYGQSYYEAFSLGHSDHNVVFAHPGNIPSLRHRLTLEMRLSRRTRTSLIVGYAGSMMQSKFNGLRYHSYTHTFMLGFTKTFRKL